MAGYSYFNYDQMTLLEVEVHSDELALLKNTADEYDWEAIKSEVEPKFKQFWIFAKRSVNLHVRINSKQRRIYKKRFPF